ncbi:hypothetical protein, conserved [Trypanosoma brucei gambiense DAL972]|uniref:Uncharacterized protein n=2 Tax=Trypanosoma brucei TaxID=5691 RepID=C9ZW56_TRYB9|nr:hypothetical protein, conserved [Trypanosoma brucei gambiense DAL972]RHW72830.1 SMP-30/Gluconolaconase/LRE-like region [Trypanosoma brucei equiperdum]CBH13645.1 hypothetical protein, conserved [Trypanosoma brucei gambiense DAL972]|eukprot:XP_011775921.1 hypothetical protein, conserved [Trypanosoma brucei gambiense DAL972]
MEFVAEAHGYLITGLALDSQGDLFAICSCSGELLRLNKEENTLVSIMATEASPYNIAIEPNSGSVFITDRSENAILKLEDAATVRAEQELREGKDQESQAAYTTVQYLNAFEGRSFLGPTAIAFSPSGELFFTDAGAEGDSSFSDPVGAVYRTTMNHEHLVPICTRGLIRPSAIAVAPDNSVYVCEQGTNRVLRFVQRSTFYVGNVFAQLQGGMGPRAIAVSPRDGSVFVAQYDISAVEAPTEEGESEKGNEDAGQGEGGDDGKVQNQSALESAGEGGIITVLGRDGDVRGIVRTMRPCITAIALDASGETLYVMEGDEANGSSKLYKLQVLPLDDQQCGGQAE